LDHRIIEHAKILIKYSTNVKEGDNLLIYVTECGMDLATEVYRQASMVGANPIICYGGHPWDANPTELLRGYYESTPIEFLKNFPQHQFELVKASNVIIHIRSAQNTLSLTSIDPKKIGLRTSALKKLVDEGMSKKWCITQYPTIGYAQTAEMSLKEYEDFVYSAVLVDWDKQNEMMNKLKTTMDETDEVRIVGPMTDISMSIKGRTSIIENGHINLPGGEVFTAPVEDSVNGEVFFDLPTIRFGREAMNVKLKLKDGKIIDYSAGKNEELVRAMINTDEGSKRLGELGIGMNKGITKFSRNLLFDEKIGGTIHLAIGNSFKDCGGKNESAIHWDLIKTMSQGKVIMDGEVIQENGKFKWE
jgi:aminopeptidase